MSMLNAFIFVREARNPLSNPYLWFRKGALKFGFPSLPPFPPSTKPEQMMFAACSNVITDIHPFLE